MFQPQTSRPRLSRARCTSTPIEAKPHHDPRQTQAHSLQQAFHTALQDAATSDINNTEEAATFDFKTALGKTGFEDAATSNNNNNIADKTSDKYASAVQDLGDVESANNNNANVEDGVDSVTVVREGVQFRTEKLDKVDKPGSGTSERLNWKAGRHQDQQNVSVFR